MSVKNISVLSKKGPNTFTYFFNLLSPSDPLTKKFIRDQIDRVFGYPLLVRFSWSTAENMLKDKAAVCTFEEVDDEENPKKRAAGTKPISSFFGAKNEGDEKKRKRHKFFDERFLTIGNAFD